MDAAADPAARRAAGRRLRDALPRSAQARWRSPDGRADPVASLLAANAGRVASLLPVKWTRMSASPFGFFRGAAALMAADLSTLPVTGLQVQLCGDAHVCNLGAYAAPDGHLVFDLNDFDETITGPWEWDLKRMTASFAVVNHDTGGKDRAGGDAVRTLVSSYREALGRFAAMTALELARYEVHRHTKTGPVADIIAQAQKATPAQTLAKLTEPGPDGTPRFHDRLPLLLHVETDLAGRIVTALGDEYRATLTDGCRRKLAAYRPVDVAFKVVGTGSIGTRDYVVLFFGRGVDDPLILQVKEELPSCCAPFLPRKMDGTLPEGQRVAEGQRRTQTFTDVFVGWTTLDGASFLVRQLSDHKAGIDPATLRGNALTEYALVCGEALAKAHARTGDATMLAGYCGEGTRLDDALAEFGSAYAAQTLQDHAALVEAVKTGRLPHA